MHCRSLDFFEQVNNLVLRQNPELLFGVCGLDHADFDVTVGQLTALKAGFECLDRRVLCITNVHIISVSPLQEGASFGSATPKCGSFPGIEGPARFNLVDLRAQIFVISGYNKADAEGSDAT